MHNCSILRVKLLGLSSSDDISNMYNLDIPTFCLDDNFIKNFIQKVVEKEELQMVDLIREWWNDHNSFKIIGDKIYPIPRLKKPPMLVSIMLCRLYGEKDSFKFKLGWFPFISRWKSVATHLFRWLKTGVSTFAVFLHIFES
jgi:hypothetical protein